MANRKSNKSANKPAVKSTEVKTAAAVSSVEEEVKSVPAVQAAPVESAPVKAEEPKKSAETKKTAESKKPAAKRTAKKTEAAKPAAKKTEPAKKSADEKGGKFVLQFESGNDYDYNDIIEKCKAAYKADNSRKQVRSIDVYVNIKENKAYYVINGKSEGQFIEL
ncbi:MAG: DUF6465 family protein [Ruminococcus sp.]|nr:DUF6465 family protein [Ruminococcus sp.]